MKKSTAIIVLSILFSIQLCASCVKGNCYDGKGTFISSEGNKYIGEWRKGRRNGEGKIYFKSGDYYIGQFKNNNFEGKGKFEYNNGELYKGEWSRGKSHGHGEYVFRNSDRYVGAFNRGELHGQGIFYYGDGSRYEGMWKHNHKDGQGSLYLPNGVVKAGLWSRNELVEEATTVLNTSPKVERTVLRECSDNKCMSGKGIYRYKDGSRWEGDFVKGYPEGQGVCYYGNGDVYRGGWKLHSPHGKGVITFASGKVYGAVWQLGLPTEQVYDDYSDLYQNNKVQKEDRTSTFKEDLGDVDIYALIVGVASYDHLPSLKYTDDDAYQLYAFLKSPEGGAIKDENINLLIDEAASQQNIVMNVNEVLAKADANDVVIFYMSGHGFEGSFAPHDFDGYNNALAYEDLMKAFEAGDAKHKLFIADACHSGSLSNAKAGFSASLGAFYNRFSEANGGAAILMSSKSTEVSLEYGGLRQGVFSYYFIRGLKGFADANKDKVVTIGELYAYVEREVRDYTGNSQTPSMIGDYDEDMPVAMIR